MVVYLPNEDKQKKEHEMKTTLNELKALEDNNNQELEKETKIANTKHHTNKLAIDELRANINKAKRKMELKTAIEAIQKRKTTYVA